MSNPSHASPRIQFKVGLFALIGLLLIGGVTVFVNDRPYWWRSCDLVHINVEDATGLKTKSPIRSLGLEIGYLRSVQLAETHVRLGICITAPVEVLPVTKAYIRGEGFLGDKFVELKPIKYTGPETDPAFEEEAIPGETHSSNRFDFMDLIFPSAHADELAPVSPGDETVTRVANENAAGAVDSERSPAEQAPEVQPPTPIGRSRNIPVGRSSQDVDNLVKQVDGLVSEMTSLTNNLKEAINPQELRRTMIQLNKTLENASKTLSPEGGLTTTAQRTLSKLEDAIEHMRDQMARVNRGEGSVGKLLNDPSYAEEIRQAIRSVNSLLGRVSTLRLLVDLGVTQLPGYDGSRGHFQLALWPAIDRYYLLGVSIDPRGTRTDTTTTTTSGALMTVTRTEQVTDGGILLTGMLGKVLWNRLDLSAGILHGDGTASLGVLLGPSGGGEERLKFLADIYSEGRKSRLDTRTTLILKPAPEGSVFRNIYVRGGLESVRKTNSGNMAWGYGIGIAFDDQDIKLLFALR